MKFTPGKLAGMKAVSDARGVDRRRGDGSAWLAAEVAGQGKGRGHRGKDMEEFKILVTEVLTRHASAILLDPEFGIPASKRRAGDAGLLMAYEKTGYDKTGPGRLRICSTSGR